jgi:CMP-N-acetylneuraminic acid synthetase|tara:strand:+ start:2262 stop:2981 length:720 start_codon:yes stop_codon:yes gene_type:complete
MEEYINNRKVWAIIPARGGSKGVIRKNIKDFCGQSLLTRSINCLKNSRCFEKIIVTSDDSEILEIANMNNVETHQRKSKLESKDDVMTDIPVLSFLNQIPMNERPEFTFMIQCTAPFMSSKKYKSAVSVLLKNPNSTVFAAEHAHQFLWEESEENLMSWKPINHPFHERAGRQFINKVQVNETGAFYGFSTENFISSGFRFHNKAIPILTDKIESIDINDETDWKFAELIYKQILNKKK